MATKTISITEEAYERLATKKRERESFSDVINRITKKTNLSDFAGLLTEKEAENLKKAIKDDRQRSRKRVERIERMLK